MNILLNKINLSASSAQNTPSFKGKECAKCEEKEQIKELAAYHTPVFMIEKPKASRVSAWSEDQKIPRDLKNELDGLMGVFLVSSSVYRKNSEVYATGNLEEYLSAAITKRENPINDRVFHVTRDSAVDSILKNGFDYSRANASRSGPGVYFTDNPFWGRAMIGRDNPIMSAKIKGVSGSVNKNFFDKIFDCKEYREKFAETVAQFDPKADPRKVLNVYAREIITDKLGYDILTTGGGGGIHYIVYNPNSISGITHEKDFGSNEDHGIPSDYFTQSY